MKQKDEELRNTPTDSTKEVMVFRRRAELAEGAAKSSRDKANLLEDVSIVSFNSLETAIHRLVKFLKIIVIERSSHGSRTISAQRGTVRYGKGLIHCMLT